MICDLCQRETAWRYSLTFRSDAAGHYEPKQVCRGCLPPSDDDEDNALRRQSVFAVRSLNAQQRREANVRAAAERRRALAGVATVTDEVPVDALDVAGSLGNEIEPDQLTLPPGGDDLPGGEP